MQKVLSTAILAMMYSWAFAASKEIESGTAAAPVEQVDDVYVILFALVFFGLIVFFFAYLWWGGKKKKAD